MNKDPKTNRPLPLFSPGDPVIPRDLPGTVCRIVEVHREAEPAGAYCGAQWLPVAYLVERPDGKRTYYSEGFLTAAVLAAAS